MNFLNFFYRDYYYFAFMFGEEVLEICFVDQSVFQLKILLVGTYLMKQKNHKFEQ